MTITYKMASLAGQIYELTPEQILGSLLQPIDAYGNWFASIYEYVSVCSILGFPQQIALGIYALILKREMKIWKDYLTDNDDWTHVYRGDTTREATAVEICFNRLRQTGNYTELLQEFLSYLIAGIAKQRCEELNYPYQIYQIWGTKWEQSVFTEVWQIAEQGNAGWFLSLVRVIVRSFHDALINARHTVYLQEKAHSMLQSFNCRAPRSAFGGSDPSRDYGGYDDLEDWLSHIFGGW